MPDKYDAMRTVTIRRIVADDPNALCAEFRGRIVATMIPHTTIASGRPDAGELARHRWSIRGPAVRAYALGTELYEDTAIAFGVLTGYAMRWAQQAILTDALAKAPELHPLLIVRDRPPEGPPPDARNGKYSTVATVGEA